MPDSRRLVAVSRELYQASTLERVQAVVTQAARELTGADGAVFAISDAGQCLYTHEDAIAALWQGQRLPMSRCISGWCMLNRAAAVVEDAAVDSRTRSEDLYRRTFAKSLAAVPIRQSAPIGAIEVCWAESRVVSPDELDSLRALAAGASVAMERTAGIVPPASAAGLSARAADRCRNLYAFLRLRLGQNLSDRELARRWGMNWRSFLNLKEGARRVPRLEELEALAEMLEVDPALVVLVARGEPADVVNRWLLEGPTSVRDNLLARLGLSDAGTEWPLLHSSIERIPCGLVTMDMRGCVRDFNARLASLVADGGQLNLGAHFINFVAPDSAAVFLKLENQALELGEAGPELVWLDQGDPLDMCMVSVADSGGRNVGFQGVLQPLPEWVTRLVGPQDSG